MRKYISGHGKYVCGTQPEAEQCSDRYVGLQKRQRYGLITHEISEVSSLRRQSNLKIGILDRMMFPYNGALYLGAFYHDQAFLNLETFSRLKLPY